MVKISSANFNIENPLVYNRTGGRQAAIIKKASKFIMLAWYRPTMLDLFNFREFNDPAGFALHESAWLFHLSLLGYPVKPDHTHFEGVPL